MRKLVPLCLVGLLFACGDDSSKKKGSTPPGVVQTPVPNTAPVTVQAVDPKLYSVVRANFQGKFIGVSDGQLFNFDENQKPTTAVQFTFASVQNSENTLLATLPRRPQRIDIINDDYVLLQRPQYGYTTPAPEYKSLDFAQDCYLINVKTGLIWKFDEYFPIFSTIQTVQNANAKKILFIGLKKTEVNGPSVSYNHIDLSKDYNFEASNQYNYTRSSSSSSKKTVISIDFSDPSQVTLRPISSGLENIEAFIANTEGNILAEESSSTTRRTLAIIQNEQKPTEVTVYNANFTRYGSSESRVVKDSKSNFWRLSRGGYDSETGKYSVKAERLALTRDLDDRPMLLPLLSLTQVTDKSFYFQYNAVPWSYQFRGHELFGLGDGLFVVNPDSTSLKFVSNSEGAYGSWDTTITNIDVQNGKVISYLKPYLGSTEYPSMLEFDLSDLSAPKASAFPSFKKVFGDVVAMTQRSTGGLELESLDGPTRHFYWYNGLNSSITFEKSVRADTDNRVRILVPVKTID